MRLGLALIAFGLVALFFALSLVTTGHYVPGGIRHPTGNEILALVGLGFIVLGLVRIGRVASRSTNRFARWAGVSLMGVTLATATFWGVALLLSGSPHT